MQTYIHIQVKIQCLSNNRWIHWYSWKFVTFLWTLTTVTLDTQPDTYLCYWIEYSILAYVVLPGEKEEMSIYRSSADTWVIQWFKCKQSTNIYIYVLHFLLGKPLYWWPDFANHRNDSMHYVTELHMMQFIWNCLRSSRESEGIHLVLDW